ncbi:MAG: MBL fold metallo-hydrolase [Pirellulaceae bacterium]
MELHFLGTTGYHPNRKRDTACLMLPELGIILDAGTGIFRARDLIATRELHIFLTHTHLDHIVGLTFLLDVLHQKNVEKTTVYVEQHKRAAIETHLFNELVFPVGPPFEIQDMGIGVTNVPGKGTLNTFQLDHPGGSLGFRFDWNQGSLAYVTDTTASESADYISQIHDVDLLVHECYFPDGFEEHAQLTGHSCLTPVAQVAAASRAKRTAIVHTSPLDEDTSSLDLLSMKHIYPHLFIPDDGEVVEF